MADTGTVPGAAHNKRRRTSPDILRIRDLPDALLANVATYLPKPSVALFAVAMTPAPASQSSWQPSTTGKAIAMSSTTPLEIQQRVNEQSVEERWKVLDFADIEKSLASKLTDVDVGGILRCIDAVSHLKTLKLTGCVNITGSGLEPLRGSSVLEQIDLSLVGQHESPRINPEPNISDALVIPILDSIIETPNKSLIHVQLPKKWRVERSFMLDQFLQRYNQVLQNRRSRRLRCSKCMRICWGETTVGSYVGLARNLDGLQYGLQAFTCYKCTKFFCYREDCFEADPLIRTCNACDRVYCGDCVPPGCAGCPTTSKCPECIEKCVRCAWVLCSDCDTGIRRCEGNGCTKVHCDDCFGGKFDVKSCESCGYQFCSDCRYSKCSEEWDLSCTECVRMIAPTIRKKLHEEKKKYRREIEQKAREIKKLRQENEYLQQEVKDLRKNI